MSTPPGAIVRKGGISTTIFVISLIAVAVGSGLGGYFVPKLFQASSSTITLNGAGSTLVYPLISAMNTNYSKTFPNILINYQPVGSGTGITDLQDQTVDFGASDAPLNNNQIQAVANSVTIPDTVAAVAVAYNIPINKTYSIHSGLHLNITVAAAIFQGNIKYWNDSSILQLNQNNPALAGVAIPYTPITIFHRSDSSGTTFVFSGWLNSTSAWKLGQSKTITWPSGSIGENGNPGVAAGVQGNAGAIGYIEVDYAVGANPPIYYAAIWNPVGKTYLLPNVSSMAAAVPNNLSLPAGDNPTAWQPINLLNSQNATAYPIVTFSYIVVYKELNVYGSAMTLTRAQDLINYLWFVVHGGQNLSASLDYLPLPQNVLANSEASLRLITYNGSQLHS